MSQFVLDASAVLALLSREKGWEQVEQATVAGAVISAVNVAEVVSKLSDTNMSEATIRQVLDLLHLEIVNFNDSLAHDTGMLRSHTKHLGLSLGDRACLALARTCNLPVLTADRAWDNLKLDIAIQLIR
jgi:ribonuclease VapC